ncbi:hypothetical protein ACIQMV_19490 [Streptomyces sp. NPDC091412]|uniref:hypothetical protein n=1 Tax=Streptomyces sp. NPDC091412 TaxID=3366002 RepID=UPI00381A7BDC
MTGHFDAAARVFGPGRRPALDLVAAFEAGQVDVAQIHHCPAEDRETAHAVSVDGTRRCWNCDHITAGTA